MDYRRDLYNRYHDEYQVADESGFDGIMINEHHSAPFCMQASITITGAVLAKISRNVKILMLGAPLPVVDNPLRLAEELAMIDCISRGRLISGVVWGGGVEGLANNVNPAYNRELDHFYSSDSIGESAEDDDEDAREQRCDRHSDVHHAHLESQIRGHCCRNIQRRLGNVCGLRLNGPSGQGRRGLTSSE